jgi:hypothetical protein
LDGFYSTISSAIRVSQQIRRSVEKQKPLTSHRSLVSRYLDTLQATRGARTRRGTSQAGLAGCGGGKVNTADSLDTADFRCVEGSWASAFSDEDARNRIRSSTATESRWRSPEVGMSERTTQLGSVHTLGLLRGARRRSLDPAKARDMVFASNRLAGCAMYPAESKWMGTWIKSVACRHTMICVARHPAHRINMGWGCLAQLVRGYCPAGHTRAGTWAGEWYNVLARGPAPISEEWIYAARRSADAVGCAAGCSREQYGRLFAVGKKREPYTFVYAVSHHEGYGLARYVISERATHS